MFNDWAIRKWSMVLGDTFPLDKASFLLCSIIPLSYIETQDNGDNLVVVALEDIRKYTQVVKEGCDFLVSKGYAKWVTDGDHNKGAEQISIGTSPNFIRCVYYFEKNVLAATIPGKVTVSPNNTYDFEATFRVLDEMLARYKTYAAKIRLKGTPEKVHTNIDTVLKNVQNTGKITGKELQVYLDAVTCMVYEYTSVPANHTNPKANAVAKNTVAMVTADKLVKVVPFFVEDYPNWAKPGYENINIFTFNMHFQTALMKMEGKSGRRAPAKKTYDDDTL